MILPSSQTSIFFPFGQIWKNSSHHRKFAPYLSDYHPLRTYPHSYSLRQLHWALNRMCNQNSNIQKNEDFQSRFYEYKILLLYLQRHHSFFNILIFYLDSSVDIGWGEPQFLDILVRLKINLFTIFFVAILKMSMIIIIGIVLQQPYYRVLVVLSIILDRFSSWLEYEYLE